MRISRVLRSLRLLLRGDDDESRFFLNLQRGVSAPLRSSAAHPLYCQFRSVPTHPVGTKRNLHLAFGFPWTPHQPCRAQPRRAQPHDCYWHSESSPAFAFRLRRTNWSHINAAMHQMIVGAPVPKMFGPPLSRGYKRNGKGINVRKIANSIAAIWRRILAKNWTQHSAAIPTKTVIDHAQPRFSFAERRGPPPKT